MRESERIAAAAGARVLATDTLPEALRLLADAGIIDRYGIRVLGTSLQSIRSAEDRGLFKELLARIGEPVPVSRTSSCPSTRAQKNCPARTSRAIAR